MRIKPWMTLLPLLVLTLSSQAASVWKVSKGNDFVYVGGTIHLLKESDYPLPDVYQKAFDDADTLLFETDIKQLSTPEFQQKMLQLMLLQDGKKLTDLLSDASLSRLDSYLQSRGITVQHVQHLKPSFLLLNLTVLELQAIGYSGTLGVDQYYSKLGEEHGKQIDWLESPESQLTALNSLSQIAPDKLVKYTLDELEQLNRVISEMKTAWQAGDLETLRALGIDDMKSTYPGVYQAMITNRNANWLPIIEALFKNDTREFVMVGALHLAGEESVFAMMRKKGYQIEKLN